MQLAVTLLTSGIPILFFFLVIGIILYNSVVFVGGRQIALVERRWFGKKMPQGRVH